MSSESQSITPFDAHEQIGRWGSGGGGGGAARPHAKTAAQRVAVDTAIAFRASRAQPAITLYGSIAITCLPHRNIGPGPFRRTIAGTSYLLESREAKNVLRTSLPYGAKSRIILLHFVDAAVRGGSPTVSVMHSRSAWLSSMGIALGGMTYRHMAEHARRIAACRLWIAKRGEEAGCPESFIDHLIFDGSARPQQASEAITSFPSHVRLNAAFHDHACPQPTALDRAAVDLIGDNSWAIDLYIWLATVLPRLAASRFVSWEALTSTIDFGLAEPRKVRAKFLETWSLVHAIYPEAQLSASPKGVLFGPSEAAIRTR